LTDKPFSWESLPEQGERYLAIDPLILEAIRELAQINKHAWQALPGIRLVLRVAAIDEVDGRLVLGLRFARELDVEPDPPPEQPERGFGSI
jgi:hypothetical protein